MENRYRTRATRDFHPLEHLEPRVLLDGDTWFDDISNFFDDSTSDLPATEDYYTPPDTSGGGGGGGDGSNYDNTVFDTLDNSSDILISPASFPPGRPKNLTAAPLSNSSIELFWDQPNNDADGFTITRHGPAGKQVIATLPSYARNFVDQNLLPGTLYSYTVSAFDGDGDASSQTSVGTLGDHLTLTVQPHSTTAGTDFTLTVESRNAQNQTDTTASSTLQVAIAKGPSGAALAGSTSAQPVAGDATFTGLSLTVAGSYRLTITDGTATTLTSSFTISPDAATAHLVLMNQPTPLVTKGLGLRVAIEDSFGNVITTNHSIVSLELVSGPGTFRGNLNVQAKKGIATFSTANLNAAGDYTLAAHDAQLTGNPLDFSQTIAPAATTIVTPNINAGGYTYGKSFTLTATLHSSPNVPFTGTANLVAQDGTVLATALVAANGKVHFSPILTPGTYIGTIQYAGDDNHTAFTSRLFTFKINLAPTTTRLLASAARLSAGDPLTLTALVSSAAGIPSGTITFFDGSTALAIMPLDDTASASDIFSSLGVGTHHLRAVYSGDSVYKSSRSQLLRVVIRPVALDVIHAV